MRAKESQHDRRKDGWVNLDDQSLIESRCQLVKTRCSHWNRSNEWFRRRSPESRPASPRTLRCPVRTRPTTTVARTSSQAPPVVCGSYCPEHFNLPQNLKRKLLPRYSLLQD